MQFRCVEGRCGLSLQEEQKDIIIRATGTKRQPHRISFFVCNLRCFFPWWNNNKTKPTNPTNKQTKNQPNTQQKTKQKTKNQQKVLTSDLINKDHLLFHINRSPEMRLLQVWLTYQFRVKYKASTANARPRFLPCFCSAIVSILTFPSSFFMVTRWLPWTWHNTVQRPEVRRRCMFSYVPFEEYGADFLLCFFHTIAMPCFYS